jgi:hypothetical protein
VNLLSAKSDFLLHVSVRCAESEICFNARMESGVWDHKKEERVSLYGAFQQMDATITVQIDAAQFVVSVDSNPVYTFAKRIDKDMKGVTYQTDSISVFADHLDVTVTTPEVPKPVTENKSTSYQQAYFSLTAADVAKQSKDEPFDYVIISSGIGGGILAADLLNKDKRMAASRSNFSSSLATADSVYNQSLQLANSQDDRTKRILVPCRISEDTLRTYFHKSVYDDLSDKYLRKAEGWMNVTYLETKPLHRKLIHRLNIHRDPLLPTTQWA